MYAPDVFGTALLWLFLTISCVLVGMYLLGGWLEMLTARRRNLGMLIDTVKSAAGQNIPIVDTLRVVAEDAKGISSSVFRRRLQSALSLAYEGFPLGEALRRQGGYFPESMCNMFGAGEKYGNLKLFAKYLQGMFADIMSFRESAVNHLAYPVVLSMALSGVFSLICMVVIPQFKLMFEELGIPISRFTNFVISNGPVFLSILPVIFGAMYVVLLFSGTLCTMLRRKLRSLARISDGIAMRIPYLGAILTKASYAQFAHSLGALIQCGMSLPEAVGASLDLDLNAVVKRRLAKARSALTEGESFSKSLRAAGVPEQMCWFAETGEDSGDLGGNMMRIAKLYRSDIKASMRTSPKMLVPLMIIPMALLCGAVVLMVWDSIIRIIMIVEVS